MSDTARMRAEKRGPINVIECTKADQWEAKRVSDMNPKQSPNTLTFGHVDAINHNTHGMGH